MNVVIKLTLAYFFFTPLLNYAMIQGISKKPHSSIPKVKKYFPITILDDYTDNFSLILPPEKISSHFEKDQYTTNILHPFEPKLFFGERKIPYVHVNFQFKATSELLVAKNDWANLLIHTIFSIEQRKKALECCSENNYLKLAKQIPLDANSNDIKKTILQLNRLLIKLTLDFFNAFNTESNFVISVSEMEIITCAQWTKKIVLSEESYSSLFKFLDGSTINIQSHAITELLLKNKKPSKKNTIFTVY